MIRAVGTAALALVLGAGSVHAQGYRLRLDVRAQAVSFRGVQLDSVLAASVAPGPAPTFDGFAVTCLPSAAFCTYFRPGPERRGGPLVTTADLAVWGLGLPGFSVRATTRVAADLGSVDTWPGTDPAMQLLEGYAEYATGGVTVQLGRTHQVTRFGFVGFDGGRVAARPLGGLAVTAYGGWGLGRGVALPVTSPALDPLDDFQPRDRQLVAGGDVSLRFSRGAGRIQYQREVDPGINAFVSERVGVNLELLPAAGLSLTGGADWDLAQGWMGSAEAAVTYAAPAGRAAVTLGARRYRPHFPLWTIWGAFTPVPYRAAFGSVAVRPVPTVELRARGETFRYDPAEASSPLVRVERDGWRVSWGASWRPRAAWLVEAGYHAETGPGAASRGVEGAVTWTPVRDASVTVHGAQLLRPLEFRFSEADVWVLGVNAGVRLNERVRATAAIVRYDERRDRPDAAAFDWDQFRLSAGVSVVLGARLDRSLIPPAVLEVPEGTR